MRRLVLMQCSHPPVQDSSNQQSTPAMALSPTNHSAPLVSAPLYEDQYVRLTSDEVAIKWYWFPLGNSKTIHLKDIHQVRAIEAPCLPRLLYLR